VLPPAEDPELDKLYELMNKEILEFPKPIPLGSYFFDNRNSFATGQAGVGKFTGLLVMFGVARVVDNHAQSTELGNRLALYLAQKLARERAAAAPRV